jgi:hypothetical protein
MAAAGCGEGHYREKASLWDEANANLRSALDEIDSPDFTTFIYKGFGYALDTEGYLMVFKIENLD